ncbi:MAG: diguanylate cyclase [Pseudomonadota bacterium]
MAREEPGLPSLHVLLEQMADATYLLDPETSNILWCNRAGHEDLGLDADEVLNHSVLSLQKDVTGLPQWSEIAAVIRGAPCYTFLGRHRHKDGSEVPVEVCTTHFVDHGREYFLSVARNVSKRLALEQDLHTRDHRLWFALNEAMDGMWDWDVITNGVFFSPQLKRMLGYGPDEMPPHVETWSRNIHPEDRDQVLFLLDEHLKGRRLRYEAEYRLRNRNGHYLWVHDRGKICERDEQGNPTRMVGMVQNITERKLLEARLESLAHVDELTRLPNRRAAMLQLEKLLALSERTGHPLCLGIIDIDHFKAINDQHGHAKGDQVLERVAQTLRDTLRRSDQIFRWGGEEFLLILPDTGPDEGEYLSARLHQQVAALDWPGSLGIAPVTISIGIACHATARGQAERLFSLADAALYRAKELGRNRTCFAGEGRETEDA